ncbi:hypothetical protein VULLAG_LOCUS12561 [Vulpes lagopus]
MELTKYKYPHRIYSRVTSFTQLLRETWSHFFFFFFFFAYQPLLGQIQNSKECRVEGLQHYPDGCLVYTQYQQAGWFPPEKQWKCQSPIPTQQSIAHYKNPM